MCCLFFHVLMCMKLLFQMHLNIKSLEEGKTTVPSFSWVMANVCLVHLYHVVTFRFIILEVLPRLYGSTGT